jgi:hypothetical protein
VVTLGHWHAGQLRPSDAPERRLCASGLASGEARPSAQIVQLGLPGIGILFLVIGVVIFLASVGKVAGYAYIGYAASAIAVLIISSVFHNAALNDVLNSIRKLFFIT